MNLIPSRSHDQNSVIGQQESPFAPVGWIGRLYRESQASCLTHPQVPTAVAWVDSDNEKILPLFPCEREVLIGWIYDLIW